MRSVFPDACDLNKRLHATDANFMKLLWTFGVMSTCVIGTLPVYSQDSHYWTQQYGAKSMLLSGSVIGGVEDLGAVYYNPGRLAVIPNTAFLLSATVYELNSIKITDAFGDSKNASTSTFKGVPTLAAGTFKIKRWPKQYFAYAMLSRQNSDFNFSYKNEVYQDVFSTLPGNEYFGAEVNVQGTSSEHWTGISWSYPVSPKFSVGVTTNYSINKQSKGNTIALQALSQSSDVAVYRLNRGYSYSQNGLLWKIGVAGDLNKWKLGLTITTPLVAIGGKGSYQFEELYSTIPGLGPKPEVYSTSYQKKLLLKYKSPWSAGFGASRKIGKNTVHFSAEWYSGISTYTMMSAADQISQSNPSDTLRFHLVGSAKSVLNGGIGAEFYISKAISGFASFSTDFSSATSDLTRFVDRKPDTNNSTWSPDFYHVGGGVVLDLQGADVTLGITHTGANMSIPRPINFPESPSQPIFTTGDNANVRWDRWRLVLSFSFPFLKDFKKQLTEKKN